MDNHFILLYADTVEHLLNMAIRNTIEFEVEDRCFTIIDTEFFKELIEKAKLKAVRFDG